MGMICFRNGKLHGDNDYQLCIAAAKTGGCSEKELPPKLEISKIRQGALEMVYSADFLPDRNSII